MRMEKANKKKPSVYIITGPNGAGKTTFAIEFLPKIAACKNFINVDLIARGLSPLDVDSVAIQAGRFFLRQLEAQIASGNDFAFETTLSGLSYLRLINDMRQKGYRIKLYYLWLPSFQLSLKRVAERVKRGGHNIPREVVIRRYAKGLKNLFNKYMIVSDYCAIFDNTSMPKLVYEHSFDEERIVDCKIYEMIREQAKGVK